MGFEKEYEKVKIPMYYTGYYEYSKAVELATGIDNKKKKGSSGVWHKLGRVDFLKVKAGSLNYANLVIKDEQRDVIPTFDMGIDETDI